MNKTKIPWCDYTVNPVKGLCPMCCEYCYARRMYKRFKWNPEIDFDTFWAGDIPRKPSKIFVGSTIELFGEWIKPKWLEQIFSQCEHYSEHTFIFLTKRPERLKKWSPFPDNCWIGVSATNYLMASNARYYLEKVQAKVKFLSIEPLLSPIHDRLYCTFDLRGRGIHWVIIGSRTQPTRHPPREWVEEIINAADKANVPVFIKEPMASHFNIQRQEYPEY